MTVFLGHKNKFLPPCPFSILNSQHSQYLEKKKPIEVNPR